MSFELSDPPVVTPAGKYVIIVDQYGYTRALERPTNRALLAFDGDDFYWVDGTDALPIVLNNIKVANETSSLNGVMAQNAGGRAYRLVNESSTKKVFKSQGGLVFLENDGVSDTGIVPMTGSGLLSQNPAGAPYWLSDNGIVYINNTGQPTAIVNGNAGQVLRIQSGVPQWLDLPSGQVASGSGSIGLEGVIARSTSVSDVNVMIPAFSLTNGSSPFNVSSVNVDLDLAAPVGFLGLDTGSEAVNKWYYIYIISDGTSVSALISEDPVSPDLGVTGYTYWGMAAVFRNDAAGNIVEFLQRGRQFSIPATVMTQNGAIVTTWGAVPQTTAMGNIVPPNVKTVSGTVGGSDTSSTNLIMSMASTVTGVGMQGVAADDFGNEFNGFKHGTGNFHNMIIADPSVPALFWKGNSNDNKRRVVITGYTI